MPVIYDSILEHHNELRSLMREMTSIKLDPDVRNKAPKGEAFLENVKELSKEVHHHMNEEEKEFFKISKKVLSDAEAKKLNDEYLIDFNRLLEKKSK